MNECSVEGCDRAVYTNGLCTLHYKEKAGKLSSTSGPAVKRGHRLCTVCGYVGKPHKHTKGSMGMEILLWLFLLIPGLAYSLWRISSRYDACPKCNSPNMIPLDSPIAIKLLADIPRQ
jgi:hypothetical protein